MSAPPFGLDSSTHHRFSALRANVFSHAWGVLVQVLVPGCAERDLRIRYQGGFLTVTARIPPASLGIPLARERRLGRAERRFQLNPTLDFARLSRSLEDGILTLRIPKRNEYEF